MRSPSASKGQTKGQNLMSEHYRITAYRSCLSIPTSWTSNACVATVVGGRGAPMNGAMPNSRPKVGVKDLMVRSISVMGSQIDSAIAYSFGECMCVQLYADSCQHVGICIRPTVDRCGSSDSRFM
jgi:hypothetical protein